MDYSPARVLSPCDSPVKNTELGCDTLLQSILLRNGFDDPTPTPRLLIAENKLTPCWNCLFDLLFLAVVIIIIHNGLPGGGAGAGI